LTLYIDTFRRSLVDNQHAHRTAYQIPRLYGATILSSRLMRLDKIVFRVRPRYLIKFSCSTPASAGDEVNSARRC
jgi:hypothetical protein